MENSICRSEVSPDPAREWGTGGIFINPVKVKGWAGRPREEVLRHLNEWNWSSYAGYAGIGAPEGRVDCKWLELMGRSTAGRRSTLYRSDP